MGKFGVIKLLQLIDRQLEWIDFSLQLCHQLLGISRLLELKDLFIVFVSFLLLLDLLLLLYVALVRRLLANMPVHQVLGVHETVIISYWDRGYDESKDTLDKNHLSAQSSVGAGVVLSTGDAGSDTHDWRSLLKHKNLCY